MSSGLKICTDTSGQRMLSNAKEMAKTANARVALYGNLDAKVCLAFQQKGII